MSLLRGSKLDMSREVARIEDDHFHIKSRVTGLQEVPTSISWEIRSKVAQMLMCILIWTLFV